MESERIIKDVTRGCRKIIRLDDRVMPSLYLFLMEKQKALIFSLYVNLEMTVYYTVWMSCCVMEMY